MKTFSYLLLVLLTAGGCTSDRYREKTEEEVSSSDEVQANKSPDVHYAPLDLDTIRTKQLIRIENGKYALHIISYSLNDSSAINRHHDGSMSVYHDRAFRLLLEGYGGSDRSIVLDKTTFRDSLDADFFQRAGLYMVDTAFVRSNALYFDAFVGVPETDYVERFNVQWIFRGPKVGTVRFISIPEEADPDRGES